MSTEKYLEEKYPQHPLLPKDLKKRALNIQASTFYLAFIFVTIIESKVKDDGCNNIIQSFYEHCLYSIIVRITTIVVFGNGYFLPIFTQNIDEVNFIKRPFSYTNNTYSFIKLGIRDMFFNIFTADYKHRQLEHSACLLYSCNSMKRLYK